MEISRIIDHTILKPEASRTEVERLCKEAKEYGFASVCVNSCHAAFVAEKLRGSGVKTCCVVGFPLGAMITSAKAFEAEEAVKNGAEEIDMVINIGALKDKNYEFVYQDIKAVVDSVKENALVKVIIETCLLSNQEKTKVCEICVEAGADYVKTSTGFSTGGAKISDVELMKKAVNGKSMIKTSGGIKTREDAERMIEAGADRIGTSNGVTIIKQ